MEVWNLTVVLYYYEAIETYSRIGLLPSIMDTESVSTPENFACEIRTNNQLKNIFSKIYSVVSSIGVRLSEAFILQDRKVGVENRFYFDESEKVKLKKMETYRHLKKEFGNCSHH